MRPSRKRGNPVQVFKGVVLHKWTWNCYATNCSAPTHMTYGRPNIHWEIALHDACEHIKEWHSRVHVSHDGGTPPNGRHISFGDDDTLMIPIQRPPLDEVRP